MKRYILIFAIFCISFGFAQNKKNSNEKGSTPIMNIVDPGGCAKYVYIDRDDDGYGAGPKICLDDVTENFASSGGDCNDNDSSINPNTRWYLDSDNDGYGSPASVRQQCAKPTPGNYILVSGDCDDTKASINPNTKWYQDLDNDTFGNPSVFVSQCTQPVGYVLNNSDCNDSNNQLNPNTIWYTDNDNDGYGSSSISPVSQCAQPVKGVLNNLDCNDNNSTITTAKTWYADTDSDGFGDPNSTVSNCTQPSGYVGNNQDECPTISGTILGCIIPSSSPTSGFGNDQNYILTITPKIAVSSVQNISNATDVENNITYFDGLGRPMQNISNGQSNQGNDIVTHIEYDAYGRQVKEYLPYPASQNSMAYITGATASNGTVSHYQGIYNDAYPFSEKLFEASPLNRVLEQGAPGYDWSFSSPTKHTIRMDYQTNTNTDAVKLFKVTTTLNSTNGVYDISLASPRDYTANELYKTITKNENWISGNNNTTEEFKDREGRVVLKRTYSDIKDINGNVTEAQAKHDTYYIYNQYGNLTYVIPPLANDAFDQQTLDGLCYQYKYDPRNRLVEKKIPGKQWEYIIYDKLDRVVATGPSLSPFTDSSGANGWLVTKYDAFNRPVLTAWYNGTVNASQRGVLQSSINGGTVFNEIKTTAPSTVNGVNFNYTTVAWPTGGYHTLTVNYYDDYVFPHAEAIPNTILGQNVYYNNTQKPKGLPTGSWVRVPETSTLYNAEKKITYHDYKARPVRTKTINHLGGYTQVDSQLDFTGKILASETRHKRMDNDAELLTREEFTYTTQDRLLTHTHQINGGAKQLLVKNTYDELGQLIGKNVGGTDVTGSTSLQKVDYKYNIRGWLKEINDIKNLGTNPKDLFAFKINYNDNETNANNLNTGEIAVSQLFNGNISETLWVTANDNATRKYGYEYDQLNRLKTAKYQLFGSLRSMAYDENLAYDSNGNITSLSRKGATVGTIAPDIDNLTYVYHTSNKNQLLKVTDNSSTAGFKDGVNTDDDYAYDDNGNMTLDKNKGITTAISYNHLNLPLKIIFPTGNIEYLYNATGQKVKKTVTETGVPTPTITDYLNGYQYKNTVLEHFPHTEGYVKYANSAYSYVFNYTDHLGNVRVSYIQNGSSLQILEESNYFPFGLKHEGYNYMPPTNNFYKYNGKELQSELGLNFYDYGARNYDPSLGRWMNIDPLAETSRRFSPYTYALNNPVFFIDPDGMEAQDNRMFHSSFLNQNGGHWSDQYRNQNNDNEEGNNNQSTHNSFDDQEKPKNKKPDPQSPEEQAKYHQDIVNMNETFGPIIELMIDLRSIFSGGIGPGPRALKTTIALKKVSAFGKLKFAQKYGINTYNKLRAAIKGTGLHAHHLIEQRFAATLGVKAGSMEAIVVTTEEHQIFTNLWRKEIGHITDKVALKTSNATPEQIYDAARRIYKNYPQILKALGL